METAASRHRAGQPHPHPENQPTKISKPADQTTTHPPRIIEADPDDLTIDGDDKTGVIEIIQTNGDDTTTYAWKDFQFDNAGKITSWTGKSGPIDKALWRKSDTAKTHGVTAKLVSAYATNGGDLIAIVEVSANRAVRVDHAAYTPTGGYRQDDTAGLYSEIDKDERTLTAFIFPKATIGGKLRLKIGRIDPKDANSSYELGTVTLTVK